jgi:hypothetical protein
MNYQKIYNQIIEKAKNRQLMGYKEKHHIVPKCLGGNNNKDNLVELTAKEHFICHRLLCEIHPCNDKLLYALWLMTIGKQKYKHIDSYSMSGKSYERLKLEFIKRSQEKIVSENHKNKISKANSKKIIQYDFQGNLIKEWNSAVEAERYMNNAPNAHWKELNNNINDCCRGKQKSSYGYIWKYKGEILDLNHHKSSLDKGKKWINNK